MKAIEAPTTSLRVLHTSDLHGSYEPLLAVQVGFHVWLDTGDFFPNKGRVQETGYRIHPETERSYQLRWLEEGKRLERLREWLDGRPALSVPGNHDFVSLAGLLRQSGADAHGITTNGIRVLGRTWAGFREVPWMQGEWPGETRDLSAAVDATFSADPDILATHPPPAGILDRPGNGVPELTHALTGRKHRIQAHFFGHEHDDGGKWVQVGQTLCVNGAMAIVIVCVGTAQRGAVQ